MIDAALPSAEKTRNLSSHIDMHTHASCTLRNPVTLTFWPRVNACRGPALE